jgi:hypothetical protein
MQGQYLVTILKDISNDVLHAQIRDDLTLALRGFVVKSQIPNLTLDHSFDHNSCILGLNEQCEGTLGIYILKSFQWYFEAQFGACLPFLLRF